MNVFGLLCIHNEVDRYLRACIEWHIGVLDGLFVYDDQSTDGSAELARTLGATVEVRPNHRLSFLEHEGEFRQAAWEAFEIAMHPDEGDWVLAFDADEFTVVPRQVDPSFLLQQVGHENTTSCRLKIHEVFDVDNGTLLVRTDGFWGDISGVRYFPYRPGGRFANRRMGCGSAPDYAYQRVEDYHCLEILHFGYARPEDRIAKHNRYFGLSGHNPQHIASIIETPTLVPWTGAGVPV